MMTSVLNKIIIFITGAALGSVVTWKVLQKRYNERINEEMTEFKKSQRDESMEKLEQMHADLMEKKEEVEAHEATLKVDENGPTLTKPIENWETTSKYYRRILEGEGYSNDDDGPAPYVIPPEEFGNDADEYDLISLNYYEDGVLADDWGDVIEDIDRVVGKDSLTHFGEYEDDSVYVRNDRLKCEYEILLRVGKFEDRLEGNLLYKDDKIFLKANPLGEEE